LYTTRIILGEKVRITVLENDISEDAQAFFKEMDVDV